MCADSTYTSSRTTYPLGGAIHRRHTGGLGGVEYPAAERGGGTLGIALKYGNLFENEFYTI